MPKTLMWSHMRPISMMACAPLVISLAMRNFSPTASCATRCPSNYEASAHVGVRTLSVKLHPAAEPRLTKR
jgi:hypothetical protein